MELALKESHRTGFSQRLPALAPWMHAFKFGPRLYTGHFKYDGVGNTWVNEQSPDGDVEQLQRAYDRFVAGDEWSQFLRSLLTTGTTASVLAGETLIDIGSAAGRNSLLAVDCGVGAVTAVEIRENQAAQLASILDAVADDRYRERVRAVHDPLWMAWIPPVLLARFFTQPMYSQRRSAGWSMFSGLPQPNAQCG